MTDKACRNCHLIITEGHVCPGCNGTDLTDKWSSYVIVVDPENSELAKKIGAKAPGKYAIRIKG